MDHSTHRGSGDADPGAETSVREGQCHVSPPPTVLHFTNHGLIPGLPSTDERLVRLLPMHTVQKGLRGRPEIIIDEAWLRDAASTQRKISYTTLAHVLGIHRNTLRKKLKSHNLLRDFSDIPDHDLDTLLRAYKQLKPNSGLRYVVGFLKSNGLHIQKARVQASLRRIDGLRHVLRNHAAIDRRQYVVPYPNYLWHIDGHHKLIRWAIVIHGGADGYDCVVSAPSTLMLSRSLCDKPCP